tara:strand:+ start:314 stop:460 length:147 start_codon:yes stop_codon:yes gene_type:complete
MNLEEEAKQFIKDRRKMSEDEIKEIVDMLRKAITIVEQAYKKLNKCKR